MSDVLDLEEWLLKKLPEYCLVKRSKKSPSGAGLPKFSRKNRGKTKPRSHTGPPLLRGFLPHNPTQIFSAEFLTANPLRLALSLNETHESMEQVYREWAQESLKRRKARR